MPCLCVTFGTMLRNEKIRLNVKFKPCFRSDRPKSCSMYIWLKLLAFTALRMISSHFLAETLNQTQAHALVNRRVKPFSRPFWFGCGGKLFPGSRTYRRSNRSPSVCSSLNRGACLHQIWPLCLWKGLWSARVCVCESVEKEP